MARRDEVAAVYNAAVLQGLALVTFPAASVIFTQADVYGLSGTEYGAMFLPQAVTAIGASLLSARLSRSLGLKRIYLLGLTANLLAMLLLIASMFATGIHDFAYAILLTATASLGIGFGLTVPVLNTMAAGFFPRKVDSAILILNALLGLGTALAPVLAAIFMRLGFWWGLPVFVSIGLLGLLALSYSLPLDPSSANTSARGSCGGARIPARFWSFAAFAFLYGVVETMNGNWAVLDMTESLDASSSLASLGLTAFWGAVTTGRLLFAAVAKWLPASTTYRLLPFVVAAAFGLTALLPRDQPVLGIVAFAVAGLGCSALLPLTISFAENSIPTMAASVAGYLIAFYQMGYGVAAFGVGPLRQGTGLSLNMILGGSAAVALAMAALSFVVIRHVHHSVTALPGAQSSKQQGVPS